MTGDPERADLLDDISRLTAANARLEAIASLTIEHMIAQATAHTWYVTEHQRKMESA